MAEVSFEVMDRGRTVLARFGTEEHIWKVVPQCLVCQSPHRLYIENLKIQGRSIRTIAEEVADLDHGKSRAPTEVSVKLHFARKHSSVPQRAMHRLLEAEAKRQGLDETVDDVLVTPHLVTQMTLERGYKRLLDGEIDVDIHSLQNAVRTSMELAKVSDQGGITGELLQAVMERMFEIFGAHMDSETFRAVARSSARDPILAPLLAKAQGKEVVAGEIEPSRDGNI